MRRGKTVPDCSAEELASLRVLASEDAPDRGKALRARIILMILDGASEQAIFRELGVGLRTIGKWRRNFGREGIAGLRDRRLGRCRVGSGYGAARDAVKALIGTPPEGRASWTVRLISKELGISLPRVREVLAGEKLSTGARIGRRPAAGRFSRPQEDREVLREWASGRAPSEKAASRARAVLMSLEGVLHGEAALRERMSVGTVTKWTLRYAGEGPRGLLDRPRRQGKGTPALSGEETERLLEIVKGDPPEGARRWSVRRAAEAAGVPPSAAGRVLASAGRSPFRPRRSPRDAALSSRTGSEMAELRLWAGGQAPDAESAWRARMAAAYLDGADRRGVAERAGASPRDVSYWTGRFAEGGTAALLGPEARAAAARASLLALTGAIGGTLASPPPDDPDGEWSRKALAEALGVSRHRLGRALEGISLPGAASGQVRLAHERTGRALAALPPGSLELLGVWAGGWDGTVPVESERASAAGGPDSGPGVAPGSVGGTDAARILAWRAAMVRLSLRRRPTADAARLCGAPVTSVRWWRRRFLAKGPVGLLPRVCAGRGASSRAALRLRLAQLMASPPLPGRGSWDPESAAVFLGVSAREAEELLETGRTE
ncbi:MAG: helix-turn-helix domain-containing protein [Deltaproteobacteria bacterium]|jgi:transposase|nr:helix-turn-helix domain-containing protein [Deltaproteobacteria bacterium]